MPKPKIGRLQDEKLTGSRAYPPKAQRAPALRKTVINPPAMNSVAPPKVEGVRPERPGTQDSRNRISENLKKYGGTSVPRTYTRNTPSSYLAQYQKATEGTNRVKTENKNRKTLEDAFRKQRNKK